MLKTSTILRLMLLLLPLVLLPAPTLSAQTSPAVFESSDCAFQTPTNRTVDCGYLIVPEDRSNPDSPSIRLHVAIFRSRASEPRPDPILYLEGGPGGSGIKQMETTFELFFAPLTRNRDFIVIDQRGTGYSEPNLFCNEMVDLAFEQLDDILSTQESTDSELAALQACHDRLAAEGINLSAYNSAENAADLADLRRALGYEEWNLYGISYGTRLALTTMRDHPEGIRSVILDSSYPPQEDLYATLAANFDRVLAGTFEGCRAEPACDEAYPDLESVFYDTITTLDENPVTVRAVLPSSGQPLEVVVNGGLFAGLMFQSYYQTSFIPAMPQLIYDASAGELSLLALIYLSLLDRADEVSNGMNLSVQCTEEVPYSDPDAAASEADSFPVLKDVLNRQVIVGQGIFAACDLWNVTSAPEIENEPVVSDIPTLVLAGQFDPITPPDWGRQVAESLSNGYFFEFPGMGHGVTIADSCPTDMTVAFLDDPGTTPDAACIDALAGDLFIVSSREVTLIPVSDETFGYTTVVPEEWVELGVGAYGRSSVGDTAIVQQIMPGFDAEGTLGLLLPVLEVEGTPELSETIRSETLVWSLYELNLQGFVVYLSLAEGEGETYIILMTATPGEADDLYGAVYLPALNAFTRVE
jgi:pimeloyl-ACP methyl ester carboxylesterase